MSNKLQKSKKSLDLFRHGDSKINKSLILGSIIATLISITPYLFYLYEGVPNTKVWNTFLFTYDSKYWEDVNYVAWIIIGKSIPLFLLFIWFFTCRHWWFHALLVPIAMYVFQIVIMLNDDSKFIDEFQIIYMIPVMAAIIPSIYLIRARIFNKINSANKSLEELEEEFKISPKNFWGKVKEYF